VRERGEGAFGFLMGYIMKRFRGRLDAKVVSELLRERLKNIHGE